LPAIGGEVQEAALTQSTENLLKRKNKKGLIADLDFTEDPPHGKQEWVAYNGHFATNWFHPRFALRSGQGRGIISDQILLAWSWNPVICL